MKGRQPDQNERAFFNDYWNNRIVTMHLQSKSIKQIIKAIKVIKDGVKLTEHHVMSIIGLHNHYMKRNKSKEPQPPASFGSKRVPYYEHEFEYHFRCEVPLDKYERAIEIKPEHLDNNYRNFITVEQNTTSA